MVEPETPVFSTRGLTKVDVMGATRIHALRGVDLDLFPGALTVMLGASGSGKSTLLNTDGTRVAADRPRR